MATAPQWPPVAEVDRRNRRRSELWLDVTLRSAGGRDIIPAEITNLSATGFLAEFSEAIEVPALLDVELPHTSSRTAEVVWTNGCLVGCNFSQPLAKSELSAAQLKSRPRPMAAPANALAGTKINPADPIWDTSSEAPADEKWSLRARLLVIGAVGTVPWLSILGLAALFA
jgi:hypothetical protein